MNSCAPAARAADSTSSAGSVGTAEGDVRVHRGGEQEAVVEDDADLAAQRRPCDVRGRRDRRDVPLRRSRRRSARRATAPSTCPTRKGPTRATVSPGGDAKVEVAERLAAVGVGELDVIEVDLARERRQLLGSRLVGDGGLEVEQLEDPLDAGPGLLGRREDARQHPGRGDELGEIGGEGEERADRDPVVEREPAAEARARRPGRASGWPAAAAGNAPAAGLPAGVSRRGSCSP